MTHPADRLLTGNGEAAAVIVRAFGFTNGDRVTKLDFRLHTGEIALLTIERLVWASQARRFAAVVEEYDLVRRFGPYERKPNEALADYVARMLEGAIERLHARIDSAADRQEAA